jgi:uncharacterized protein YkwD
VKRKRSFPTKTLFFAVVCSLVLMLNACQVGQTISGWFATDTPTPTFTFTPTATATFTLTPTVTFTFTPTATFKPTATNTPLPTKTPAPVVEAGCNGANAGIEGQVFSLINKRRAENGAAALNYNYSLAAAASAHSQDMAQGGFISHTGSNGSDPGSRISSHGYSYSAYGEIIYKGPGSYNNAGSAVSAWMDSSAHHDILVSTTYTDAGVGYWCVQGDNDTGYFTVDFGRR